jgi:Na+/H+ antiporter NhaD/arsenite permease-like protein
VWPALVIFAATYVLIAARRLSLLPIGRPAGALAGAAAMVLLSLRGPGYGLTPHEAFAAVEPNTIGLLLGMMLLAAGLGEAGFFEIAADWIARRRLSPVATLYATSIGGGLLSALLVNDSVCLLLAPLCDRTAKKLGLPRVPYLLALAMGANAGSAITIAGNPQNMLVAQLSGISYRGYLATGGVAGIIGLGVTAVVLHLLLGKQLPASSAAPLTAPPALAPLTAPPALATADPEPPTPVALASSPHRRREIALALGCLAAVSIAFFLGANLAWGALCGATVMMLLRRQDTAKLFDGVSWTVLVFFAALFIVVAGLQKTGMPAAALAAISPYMPESVAARVAFLSGALLAGCQIVSNVPLILLVEPWIHAQPDPHLAWTVTAVVSTLAGNLTLLGSVANIIVIETTGASEDIGFVSYFKIGLPVTLASTALAVLWLLVSGS